MGQRRSAANVHPDEGYTQWVRLWAATLLKLLWAAYMVLSSVYCLLAFLPYTYLALVKAPPYDWIAWFVEHHALLCWVAALFSIAGFWRTKRNTPVLVACVGQALLAIYLTMRPVLPALGNNSAAYAWSLGFLLPPLLISALELQLHLSDEDNASRSPRLLPFSGLAIVGAAIALSSAAGGYVLAYTETGMWGLHAKDIELSA